MRNGVGRKFIVTAQNLQQEGKCNLNTSFDAHHAIVGFIDEARGRYFVSLKKLFGNLFGEIKSHFVLKRAVHYFFRVFLLSQAMETKIYDTKDHKFSDEDCQLRKTFEASQLFLSFCFSSRMSKREAAEAKSLKFNEKGS